ncbi:F-box domain-containing protein [Entamoeba marina]
MTTSQIHSILDLPLNIQKRIAANLDPLDILTLSETCTKLSPLINDVEVWHELMGYTQEDTLKTLEEYQQDYIIIKQYNRNDLSGFDLKKPHQKYQKKPKPFSKVIMILAYICINISWDYITYIFDSLFITLFVLELDRITSIGYTLPLLFFILSLTIRSTFPYIIILSLKYVYGPFFDIEYLPQQNISVCMLLFVYVFTSPYIGIIAFGGVLVLLFNILILLYSFGYIALYYALIPVGVFSLLAIFSCSNFTCLPTCTKVPCSLTKLLYFSIPSVNIFIGLILSIINQRGSINLPYLVCFIPFYLTILYILLLNGGVMFYLCTKKSVLVVSDIKFNKLLFPCWRSKPIEDALFLSEVLVTFLFSIMIPSVLFLVLLGLKFDGFVDISYSIIFIPVYLLIIGFVFTNIATHVGCCVLHDNLNNHQILNNSNDDY